MLRWGQPLVQELKAHYVDEGAAVYEKRFKESRFKSLTAMAKDLGYEVSLKASEA